MIEKIALQAAWNQRENIFKIFGAFSFLCALPLLFMLMLPSAVFGDFALNTDIFNNNSLIAENLSECENVVWSAVNESHEKITDEIYSKIDLLGENEIGILDDTFAYYDDQRLERTLRWLDKSGHQVIVFTCQKREEELMKKNGILFHKIELGTEQNP